MGLWAALCKSASSGKPYLSQLGSTLLLWFESNGSQRHMWVTLF
jgi:hypothetical protein